MTPSEPLVSLPIRTTTKPENLTVFGTREEALAHVEDQLIEQLRRRDATASDADEMPDLDAESTIEAARSTDLLRDTDDEVAETIWSRAQKLRVREGEPVLDLEPGESAVVLVVEGLVEMIPHGSHEDGSVVRRMRPGTVFRSSCVSDERLSVQAVAGTDLVVRVLDAPALRALEQEEPAAALELWRSMARAASEDLETALCANIGWEPGDHWNETPVED